MLVVSNNNSAIENVKEKLAKHDLDFLVATLGKAENKQLFIQEQRNGRDYPSQMSQWRDKEVCAKDFVKGLSQDVEKVQSFFVKQERLAEAIKEYDAIVHIALSSGLSSSCENATNVSKKLKNV